MSNFIKSRKFSPLSHQELTIAAKLDLVVMKNSQCIKRLANSVTTKGSRYAKANKISGYDFKKYWLCNNCLTVFNLKPAIRYKTLLEYKTNCRNCNSKNTAHNEALVKAIKDKQTPAELLELARFGVCINPNLTDRSKYYIDFYSKVPKEIHPEAKQYFSLA